MANLRTNSKDRIALGMIQMNGGVIVGGARYKDAACMGLEAKGLIVKNGLNYELTPQALTILGVM